MSLEEDEETGRISSGNEENDDGGGSSSPLREETPLLSSTDNTTVTFHPLSEDPNENENASSSFLLDGGPVIAETIVEGAEAVIENAKELLETLEDNAQQAWSEYDDRRHYDWRDFYNGNTITEFLRWLATGLDNHKQLARKLGTLGEAYFLVARISHSVWYAEVRDCSRSRVYITRGY